MARKGEPGPAHKFKPGKSGNPSGRPKLTPEIKQAQALKQMTGAEMITCLSDFLKMDRASVKQISLSNTRPMLDVIVACIVDKAATHGDQQRLNFLFDRIVGKVKDVVQHQGPDGNAVQIIVMLPSNGTEAPESVKAISPAS